MVTPSIVLASQSPRRKELLSQIGLECVVMPANVDESLCPYEQAEHYVLRIAKSKAENIIQKLQLINQARHNVIIAADTTVCIDQEILSKPKNFMDACRMWQLLSGREHQVKTAVVIAYDDKILHEVVTTYVKFKELSLVEMQAYWNTGEPQDKAGGYAIQGRAATWIKNMKGSYSNVVGLPLYETMQLLEQLHLGI